MKPSHTETAANAERQPLPAEWKRTIDAFLDFQRVHRGVSSSLIRQHRRLLAAFVRHVSPPSALIRVDQLQARHIDEFLIAHAGPRGRSFAGQAVNSLRSFLRYLALLGDVSAELIEQVPRQRSYRLANLPRALGGEDLQRILRATPRGDARGRRDYAMLMLLATYGLRSGDVIALRLEDLRWRHGTIAVHTRKTGQPLVLPITDSVGDALADYLRRGRPRCGYREVFVSLSTKPTRPLGTSGILQVVRRAFDRAGVNLRGVAGHAFRHGFASRLVRRGVALDTVAGCLGHASSATTFIYTKLQVDDLRSVSRDPREVIA